MKSINIEHALETAKKLAVQAGKYSKEKFGTVGIQWKDLDVSDMKGAKKYIAQSVTPVDYACQRMILKGLKQEDFHKVIGVFAEEKMEELKDFADNPDLRWIIDPIDGTFNYATANEESRKALEDKLGMKIERDHKLYGVSIGVQENQQDFVLGVVYLPFLNELYVASRGNGATKNGKRLSVQQEEFTENSIIHLNSKSDFAKEIFDKWEQPVCTVYSITGVADGKNTAFFARETHLHDVGPSTLIVQEAGGYVSDQDGKPIDYGVADENGKLPFYVAGPSKEINLALLQKIRDSGFEFK